MNSVLRSEINVFVPMAFAFRVAYLRCLVRGSSISGSCGSARPGWRRAAGLHFGRRRLSGDFIEPQYTVEQRFTRRVGTPLRRSPVRGIALSVTEASGDV